MSQLTLIQDELRRRFQRPPQLDERLPDGRSVYEGVRQTPAPEPPRAFAPPETRPRMVNPQPSDPEATRQRAVSFDPQTQEPHREFYANNPDAVAGATGYRDALEKWKPPKKRSLKTVLKEGVMGAATAINANPQNPVEAAIGGFGAGAISGVVQPNAITRAYKLNRANKQLEGRIGEAKTLAQTQALQTRPGIQQDAQDEKEINNALSQWNKSDYDPTNPEHAGLKRYFETRGLNLPKRVKGSNIVANWSNGRLVLTDKTTAESRDTTVTDVGRTPNEQGLTPNQAAGQQTRERSINAANTRAANSITAANTRAANAQAGANARAGGRGTTGRAPTPDRAAQRKAAELVGKLDNVRQRIAAADDRIARDPSDSKAKEARANAVQFGAQFAGELNALGAGYEAGVGDKEYPYYKKNAQAALSSSYAGRTMSQANLARYAKDHGMTIEQAKASPELRDIVIR